MSDRPKSPLAIARDKWIESDEGKRLMIGSTSGVYLKNRLEMAFIDGYGASEEHLLPAILESAITLEWMLKDMKCKYRWEKNIPEELDDGFVDYSPELTKAIELHKKLKSIIGE
jgi:hypothetical protein